MKNTNSVSVTEKELLLELEHILVNHRYNCARIENINTSNSTYMYRIKKALQKSKVEEKRVEVLKIIIDSINNKIDKGMLFKEIFEPLPAIIIDELKNYNKNITIGFNEKKEADEEVIKDDKAEKRLAKIKFFSDVIDKLLLELEDINRSDLLKLENKYKNNLRESTNNYNYQKASGEILGALNVGMIENTRKNFEKMLYDECRIKIKSTDNLSDKMSEELLKYRVAALIYTNVMCNKRTKKINPNQNNKINQKEYIGLKKDVTFLGKVVREKYIDEYHISPKEELIENYIGGQMTFKGLMEKRDIVVRKHNLK